MNIEKMIQETVQATTEAMFKELKKRNMLKSTEKTAFQQTETILYNYPKYQDIIKSKLQEIDEIKKSGISRKSGSIVQYRKNTSFHDVSDELFQAEAAIEKLENNIREIESYLSTIDNAMKIISDDPYYEIIEQRYFKGCSQEEIADYFECDVSTIRRNKNRLLNVLRIHLFPNQCIWEIGIIA